MDAVADAREAQRLEAEDREDAGHDVEDQPADQRAEQRQEDRSAPGRRRPGDRRPRRRHWPRRRGEGKARASAGREHAVEGREPGSTGPGLGLDHQRVAVSRHRLRRRITQRVVGGRIDIGIGEHRACRERDREPQLAVRHREMRRTGERSRQRLAVAIERRIVPAGRADIELGRDAGGFRDAQLLGADQIIEPRIDRHDHARLRVGRHVDRREQRIIALEHIIHQPRHAEPLRHRILQRIGAPLLAEPPFDPRLGSGVAGIAPIAVPARLRPHHEGERHRAARRHALRFGDERDAHMVGGLGRRGRDQCEKGGEERREPSHDAAIAGSFRPRKGSADRGRTIARGEERMRRPGRRRHHQATENRQEHEPSHAAQIGHRATAVDARTGLTFCCPGTGRNQSRFGRSQRVA